MMVIIALLVIISKKITKNFIIVAEAKKSYCLCWMEASVNTNYVNAIKSVESSDL